MFSVYKEPVVYEKVLTPEFCDKIINSIGELEVSKVGSHEVHENIRKSYGGLISDKRLVNTLLDKCSEILNVKEFHLEAPHVVYYKTGGFYEPHIDPHPDQISSSERPFTFIFILNDDYEGGETYFPNLNVSFKLKKGDALFFHNYNTDGTYTQLALHGGKHVKSGEKWICNVWLTKSPY